MSILMKFRGLWQPNKVRCVRQISFFGKAKEKEDKEKVEEIFVRKPKATDQLTRQQLNLIAAQKSLTTKRPYDPPQDVEQRLETIVNSAAVDTPQNWRDVSLESPEIKFKITSSAISEFNHDVPNQLLNDMNTVDDLLTYFSTPVLQTTAYEDMSKLDLPKNLHIIEDYVRFNPETEFDGKSAFPNRDTVVKSLKYKRKYKDIKTTKRVPGYVNKYGLGF